MRLDDDELSKLIAGAAAARAARNRRRGDAAPGRAPPCGDGSCWARRCGVGRVLLLVLRPGPRPDRS